MITIFWNGFNMFQPPESGSRTRPLSNGTGKRLSSGLGNDWVVCTKFAMGQKENPLETIGFSLFFLLPIGFFGYPVFLTHCQMATFILAILILGV